MDDESTETTAHPPLEEGRVGPMEFHAHPGVEDWRVMFWGAHVFYRTSSFAEGARFVAAVAEAAADVGHEPDVDLRPEGVVVRSFTREDGALGPKDAVLAAAVSRAAHKLGLESDPSALVVVGIAVAQNTDVDTRPFWEGAFGYRRIGDEDLVDPLRRGPHLWFHEVDPPRPGRGRTHIDVSVPADQAEKRLKAALAGGGRLVRGSDEDRSWTIASPDNHGVDIAGWADLQA